MEEGKAEVDGELTAAVSDFESALRLQPPKESEVVISSLLRRALLLLGGEPLEIGKRQRVHIIYSDLWACLYCAFLK